MSVVVLIRGREAIPVRAIPYVTGWDVSPDMVTKSLANSPNGIRLDWLTAYQYHADGSHTPILPKEWDGIDDRLRGLSASSKAKSNNNDVARTKWLKKSIPILPAGVFVWRDELEKSWRRFCWLVENRKGERPNDGMLNFSPMIPTELFEQVCEGFTFPRAVTDTAQQVPDEAQEQTAPSGTPEKATPEVATADDDEQGDLPRLAKEPEQKADYDAGIAALFDPVKAVTLEAMFPDENWSKYAARASRNGLKDAARRPAAANSTRTALLSGGLLKARRAGSGNAV
ncbi:MAG: hypothetical protein V5B34_17720 [Accumulibacter sp.]|jgi:hypothetical protein